jgi:hypothetical protein
MAPDIVLYTPNWFNQFKVKMQKTIVKLMSASVIGWMANMTRFHSLGIAGMKR